MINTAVVRSMAVAQSGAAARLTSARVSVGAAASASSVLPSGRSWSANSPSSSSSSMRPISPGTIRYATTSITDSKSVKKPLSKVAIVSKLRKTFECSISKAREAIEKSDGTFEGSLAWLKDDAAKSGAKKAAKVQGRIAAEGLLAFASPYTCIDPSAKVDESTMNLTPKTSSIVELNTETDFAARNPMFLKLAEDIAFTARFFAGDAYMSLDGKTGEESLKKSRTYGEFIRDLPLDYIMSAPMLDAHSTSSSGEAATVRTVSEAILETIGKLGENIKLRRVSAVIEPQGVSGSDARTIIGNYAHGSDGFGSKIAGKIAATVVIRVPNGIPQGQDEEIQRVSNKVAQQITGFNPEFVDEKSVDSEDLQKLVQLNAGESEQEILDRVVLTRQPFLFGKFNESTGRQETVAEILNQLGENVEIVGFNRWECGEGIDKKVDDFAEEVRKQAGM